MSSTKRVRALERPHGATLDRRQALSWLAAGVVGTSIAPRLWSQSDVVVSEQWADVVRVGEEAWAVLSKPRGGSFKTLCNGGFVAGSDRVLAIDAYAGDEGADWVIERCRELTGRAPTDVVLSHHHGDHVGGVAAFARAGATVHTTETMRGRIEAAGGNLSDDTSQALADANLLTETAEVDLGGRGARLHVLAGHTPSDLAVQVGTEVLYGGDLIWNGLFPNYMDALPEVLRSSVAALGEVGAKTLVPGHGVVPEGDAFSRYVGLLDAVEDAARKSHSAGQSAADAAAAYSVPEELGEWFLFGPTFLPRAFEAWYRVLG